MVSGNGFQILFPRSFVRSFFPPSALARADDQPQRRRDSAALWNFDASRRRRRLRRLSGEAKRLVTPLTSERAAMDALSLIGLSNLDLAPTHGRDGRRSTSTCSLARSLQSAIRNLLLNMTFRGGAPSLQNAHSHHLHEYSPTDNTTATLSDVITAKGNSFFLPSHKGFVGRRARCCCSSTESGVSSDSGFR